MAIFKEGLTETHFTDWTRYALTATAVIENIFASGAGTLQST